EIVLRNDDCLPKLYNTPTFPFRLQSLPPQPHQRWGKKCYHANQRNHYPKKYKSLYNPDIICDKAGAEQPNYRRNNRKTVIQRKYPSKHIVSDFFLNDSRETYIV